MFGYSTVLILLTPWSQHLEKSSRVCTGSRGCNNSVSTGAHEPPKERVTHEYYRVPCKYKSWERASSNDFKNFHIWKAGARWLRTWRRKTGNYISLRNRFVFTWHRSYMLLRRLRRLMRSWSQLQKGGYNLKQVTNVIDSSVLTFSFDWFDWFHLLFAYSTRMLVYQVTQWQSLGMRQTYMYVSF